MYQGKRIIRVITGLALAAVIGMGTNPVQAASVSKIKWSNVKTKKTLYKGNPKTFTVTITPTSAKKAKLVWSSSKKSVATVSSKGKVTPKKNGTAYITCKVKAKPSKKVKCKVTVKTQKAKSVSFAKSTLAVQKGKSVTMKGVVYPSYTSNKKLKYTTSNSKIATVTSAGKVTGKAQGTATIKATTTDGSKKYKKYKIRVVGTITKTSTKFIAHRGLSASAPENTVKAYELAGKAGFWGAETDVRKTKDDKFVLCHDLTFKRLCGVDKAPEDMTLAEIKKLTIISGNGLSTYKNDATATTIPTLEEYLETCKTYGMVPVIELKMEYTKGKDQTFEQMQEMVNSDMTKLHTATKSVMGTAQYKYIAYDLETLVQINKVLKIDNLKNVTLEHVVNYPVAGNIGFYQNREIGIDAQYDNTTPEALKKFKDAGISTNVWAIDDVGAVWDYVQSGVDSITTNTKFW